MSDPASVPLVPAALLHALTVAHAEIARLRLTGAERVAIYRASQYLSQNDAFEGMAEDAAVLRALLERLGGGE